MLEGYTDKRKSQCLDEILSHYFERNFGTMAKSDFETLLFHIYIDYKREYEKGRCDEYELSRELGISQQKVRNLIKKTELIYPRDNFQEMWKEMFVDDIKYANYDDRSGLVKMHVSDPLVMDELRHYMEANSWYSEYQLNPKLFQCPLNMFISLCQKLDGQEDVHIDKETEKKLKELQKTQINEDGRSAIELLIGGDIKNGLGKLAGNVGENVVQEVIRCIPFGKTVNVLYEALTKK